MKFARKYNNKKITYKGIQFDSKSEFERYLILDDMRKMGEITELQVHPEFKLFCGDNPIMGLKQKNKQLVYTADFSYRKDGEWIVEEIKPFKKRKSSSKRYPYLDSAGSIRIAVAQACYGFEVRFVE